MLLACWSDNKMATGWTTMPRHCWLSLPFWRDDKTVVARMAVLACWRNIELAVGRTMVLSCWCDNKLAAVWMVVLACWRDVELAPEGTKVLACWSDNKLAAGQMMVPWHRWLSLTHLCNGGSSGSDDGALALLAILAL